MVVLDAMKSEQCKIEKRDAQAMRRVPKEDCRATPWRGRETLNVVSGQTRSLQTFMFVCKENIDKQIQFYKDKVTGD